MSGAAIDKKLATITALRYRAYTAGWSRPLAGNAALGPNNGMPGPTLRARVGDVIRVHFRNNDTHYRMNHGMHPHGVFYTPANDGAEIMSDPGRHGALAPGQSYTYEWRVRPDSVGTWVYHDHTMSPPLPGAHSDDMAVGPPMELGAQLGLFGVIAITDAHTPAVDKEIVLFFHDMYGDDIPSLGRDWDCFNGYAYLGNTPTFTARRGQRVRWRVAALGTEFHVFHVHGHRWRALDGSFEDTAILGPATTLTVGWTEDNPGRWLYHCHVGDHMMGGMIGHYAVT